MTSQPPDHHQPPPAIRKLYQPFQLEMVPWEMKVEGRPSCDIQREIEKIKKLTLGSISVYLKYYVWVYSYM
jgi:hypothetical protein